MDNTRPENLLPAPDTTLTLPALVTLMHTLGISRLVRPEITEKGLPAVRLCGLMNQQEHWQIEQVRGPNNGPVSEGMARLAKRVELAVRHFQN
ncbi:TPA: hypothetical protein LVM22_001148 [Klebsiella oxytoca]|nr:hypothetical protein [Klebsiella oxytoca]